MFPMVGAHAQAASCIALCTADACGLVEDGSPHRRVGVRPRGGEEILPGERSRRVEHLGTKRVRPIGLTAAGFELGPVPMLDLLGLNSQALADTRWMVLCTASMRVMGMFLGSVRRAILVAYQEVSTRASGELRGARRFLSMEVAMPRKNVVQALPQIEAA